MPILDWMNKKQALTTADKTPYKVLVENKDLSYGDQSLGNMIIKGDNLEALKALLPYYKGQVKCIYIDPPYNTGNAFEHYDDNLEHSIWLSLMYPRLELLRELLSEDGSIFVQIDDEEQAYLKIIMDEIFGRKNFIITLPRVTKRAGKSTVGITKNHDYILVYKKSGENINVNQLNVDVVDYPNKDEYEKERGSYKLNQTLDYSSIQYSPSLDYEIELNGRIFRPGNVTKEEMEKRQKLNPKSDFCWRWSKDLLSFGLKNDFIVIKGKRLYTKTYTKAKIEKNNNGKYEIVYVERGKNPTSLDFVDNIFSNDNSRKNIENIFGYKAFDYAKPESLIERILTITTKENDLILDSFLGSGTTCAVAQKMNRRYIGIEMGDHAVTHCVPRMKKVIDGTDEDGISKNVNWKGGGGYTFYDLGNSIFDTEGNINNNIKFKDLAFHVWFSETKTPLKNYKHSPLIGIFKDTAYYLLYNGILGDKSISGGNVLTSKLLAKLPKYNGKKIIYGEVCRLSAEKLLKENIIFKQTPYDIKAR